MSKINEADRIQQMQIYIVKQRGVVRVQETKRNAQSEGEIFDVARDRQTETGHSKWVQNISKLLVF